MTSPKATLLREVVLDQDALRERKFKLQPIGTRVKVLSQQPSPGLRTSSALVQPGRRNGSLDA